jgi:hypothetical protein
MAYGKLVDDDGNELPDQPAKPPRPEWLNRPPKRN